MNLKWVIQGRSSCGGYCTAQGTLSDTSFSIHTPHTNVSILKGVFQQIGAPAVALSSLVSLIVFKSFHH